MWLSLQLCSLKALGLFQSCIGDVTLFSHERGCRNHGYPNFIGGILRRTTVGPQFWRLCPCGWFACDVIFPSQAVDSESKYSSHCTLYNHKNGPKNLFPIPCPKPEIL